MREIYYFIEDTITNKWHYIDKRKKEDSLFCMDSTLYHYNEWTNHPMTAMRFNSKENAEGYLKHNSELRELENIEITEHEFVCSPIPS